MHDWSTCSWIANWRVVLVLARENPLAYPQCNASDVENLIPIGHCMTVKLSTTYRVMFSIFFLMTRWLLYFVLKVSDVNESMAKWFHDSGSSMYIFLDDLPSQTGVCLNNGRRWKTAQKQVSLIVPQYKGVVSEYRNLWKALTVAEVSKSQWPLSTWDFHVSLHVVYVDYDVLLCEPKLSE